MFFLFLQIKLTHLSPLLPSLLLLLPSSSGVVRLATESSVGVFRLLGGKQLTTVAVRTAVQAWLVLESVVANEVIVLAVPLGAEVAPEAAHRVTTFQVDFQERSGEGKEKRG